MSFLSFFFSYRGSLRRRDTRGDDFSRAYPLSPRNSGEGDPRGIGGLARWPKSICLSLRVSLSPSIKPRGTAGRAQGGRGHVARNARPVSRSPRDGGANGTRPDARIAREPVGVSLSRDVGRLRRRGGGGGDRDARRAEKKRVNAPPSAEGGGAFRNGTGIGWRRGSSRLATRLGDSGSLYTNTSPKDRRRRRALRAPLVPFLLLSLSRPTRRAGGGRAGVEEKSACKSSAVAFRGPRENAARTPRHVTIEGDNLDGTDRCPLLDNARDRV